MKSLQTLVVVLVAVFGSITAANSQGIATVPSEVPVTNPPQSHLPNKLSGMWTTVDGRGTGEIALDIDSAGGKATLYVFSNYGFCTIKDAPATVSTEANKLKVQVDPAYSNFCRKDISLELVKRDGSEDYEGELQQGGRAKDRDPILKVKLHP